MSFVTGKRLKDNSKKDGQSGELSGNIQEGNGKSRRQNSREMKRRSSKYFLPSEEQLYLHWLPILSNGTVNYY